MFGFQHEAGVIPDIIALSKHFGGGPADQRRLHHRRDRPQRPWTTATSPPAHMPAIRSSALPGKESLDIIVDEDLPGRAARIESRIKDALAAMGSELELIGDVRGRGVLLGIELVTDREKKTPANAAAQEIAKHCLDSGLIFQLRGTRGDLNVIRLVPPMTTTDAEVDRAMSILYEALKTAERGPRPARPAADVTGTRERVDARTIQSER